MCLEIIKKEFEKYQLSSIDMSLILDLNFELFKNIMSSDELQIKNEKDVCELVLRYIKSRRQMKVDLNPSLMIENKKKEIPKEENEIKENQLQEQKQVDPPQEEEEKKEELPQIEEEEKREEIQLTNNNPQVNLLQKWKEHTELIKKSIDKIPLTKEQEKELIECIRFSFLSHSDLLGYTGDIIVKEHQDLLLEGLSVRLNTYENTNHHPLKINLIPRHYYVSSSSTIQQQKPNQNQDYQLENSKAIDEQMYSSIPQYQDNAMRSLAKKSYQPFLKESMLYDSIQHQNNKYENTQMNAMDESLPISVNQHINDKVRLIHTQSDIDSSLSQDKINVETITKQSKMHNDYFSKSLFNPKDPQDPIISLDFHKNMSIANNGLSFNYEYDFDENGLFYYLGTLGKTTTYRNPYEIDQVKVFASSIVKGSLADFVGRNSVNLRTLNEENSFIGIDLGKERLLVPSCYSFKNRNSSSHVMLCWQLEASNDKISFDILDRRIFSIANNTKKHQSIEKERNLLKQPGCTSTWNLNKKIREKYPDGFRYFLLKQIDKNSSGGYNMAISGFELYGEAIGRNWGFN